MATTTTSTTTTSTTTTTTRTTTTKSLITLFPPQNSDYQQMKPAETMLDDKVFNPDDPQVQSWSKFVIYKSFSYKMTLKCVDIRYNFVV